MLDNGLNFLLHFFGLINLRLSIFRFHSSLILFHKLFGKKDLSLELSAG